MKKSDDQHQGPVDRPSTAAARAEEVAATLASYRAQRLERQRQTAALLTQVRAERQAARRALRVGGAGVEPAKPGVVQPLIATDTSENGNRGGDKAENGKGFAAGTAPVVPDTGAEAPLTQAIQDGAIDETDEVLGDLDGDLDASAHAELIGPARESILEAPIAVEPDLQGAPHNPTAEATLSQRPIEGEFAQADPVVVLPDSVDLAAGGGFPVVEDLDAHDEATDDGAEDVGDAATPEGAPPAPVSSLPPTLRSTTPRPPL